MSNDNAFIESLFRSLKYCPRYPSQGFMDLAEARQWSARFVEWYNTKHRHSALRFVTPQERHQGLDKSVLAARHALYLNAKEANPRRWTQGVRNWAPIGPVALNPEKDDIAAQALNRALAA